MLPPPPGPFLQKTVQRVVVALATCALALVVLGIAGRLLGVDVLLTFGSGQALRPPVGLGLMGLLAVAILLAEGRPRSAPLRRLAAGMAVGAGIAGAVLPLGGWSSGTMAVAVVGIALSALLRWLSPAPSRGARQAAAVGVHVPLVIGTVVVVSHAAGAPSLYEASALPMFLPSALCAVLLGLALLLAGGSDIWPLAAFQLLSTRKDGPNGDSGRWPGAGPLALFLTTGAVILIVGSLHLRSQLRSARQQAQEELAAIAGLKARQAEAWYGERHSDADQMRSRVYLHARLRDFLSGASRIPAAEVEASLKELRRDVYQHAALVDGNGRVRLAVPAEAGADEVLAEPADGRLRLRIPLGSGESGWLVLTADIRSALGSGIESWRAGAPIETLMIPPGGVPGLVLNPAKEEADLATGRDGRGVPVLAVLRDVPGTPWRVAAKVDAAGVYGPMRQRVWVTGAGLMALLALAAAVVGLMVRHREAGMVHAQLVLSQRFEWLMREANDIILLLDEEGRIREANQRAVESYGYTAEELRGRSISMLRLSEAAPLVQEQLARLRVVGALRFETRHRRRDGSTFPVEVSSRLVRLDGERGVISFMRDISEREARQHEIQRMTQLYAALSQVNQAIVWSATRETLFAKICGAMVVFGKFSMAWIGWEDPATHRVEVVGRHGDTTGLLDRVVVRADQSSEGQGAVGQAIRLGRPCILNDFIAAQASSPWREELVAAGFASIAAFPIREGGEVRGALTVYAHEKDFFGVQEVALLEEAAVDISFALDHLAGEARRREVELALQESERSLREAQQAGGVGTYAWDIRADSWKSSAQLDRIFGVGPDHPRTLESWRALVVPEARERMERYVAGLVARHEAFDLEYPIIRVSDGVRRWVHGRGELHYDEEGHPRALVGIIQDITDRKQDEEALRKVTVAVEQSPLSIVITDPEGRIEYVNPAFTATTHYAAEEALGRNPRILKSPSTPPEHYRPMWEALARGEVWRGEFENLRKGGEPFYERAILAPVRDEKGDLTGYIAIKEDITGLKRAEAERRALEAQLQQAQKLESLGSLAGGVAHDMNNVLGAILGLASSLQENPDDPQALAKSLETITTACLRGRGVVKSLLYFARQDLQEERPLDLNALVREMGHLLSHTTLKRIHLEMDLAPDLRWVRGDGGALSHAIMNLCVNAMDAMPGGGTLAISTRASANGGVELRVKDTGEGMSPEVLAKAMEPFFSTKPQGKGTGLGLAMVYGTMKAHEGNLELSSVLGAGTEAILRFPPFRVESAMLPEPTPRPEPEALQPLRILLVDDDELIRDSLGPMLEMLDHEVTLAASAEEALQLMEEGLAPELVLLDMNMPGLGGPEALPRLRALRPGIPVILSTGYSDQEMAPLLAAHPGVTSIRKPFTAKEIQQKIATLAIQPAKD
ncbi:PAS domain S-box protein [Geothrix sp. 21YS21S-4]|uniref:PAS domain S-box protein n=1 Tax=Geothrix sp. 21YS21S-4 TaxID=3068889 RepID=UPI0027BA9767|nr:PAS domain S-box protein [Geothrix sp. 21YS21S-4]